MRKGSIEQNAFWVKEKEQITELRAEEREQRTESTGNRADSRGK
jgi:hypothetical protein